MAVPVRKNPLEELWKKLPPYLRNRYMIVLILFLLLMVFWDKQNVVAQFHLRSTVNNLEAERELLKEQIKDAQAERMDMQVNQERFARENYYMQRSNEDVFIIVPEEED